MTRLRGRLLSDITPREMEQIEERVEARALNEYLDTFDGPEDEDFRRGSGRW